jgi:hypothetical protein
MISRRVFLLAIVLGLVIASFAASAAETNPYTAEAFGQAQKAGKSILVHITLPGAWSARRRSRSWPS